jgi:hypothetical protein
MEDKMHKGRGAHESSPCGSVVGRRSCPVQAADNEEDHADKSLACVDDDTTTKFIGGKGPESDSNEIAAATKTTED